MTICWLDQPGTKQLTLPETIRGWPHLTRGVCNGTRRMIQSLCLFFFKHSMLKNALLADFWLVWQLRKHLRKTLKSGVLHNVKRFGELICEGPEDQSRGILSSYSPKRFILCPRNVKQQDRIMRQRGKHPVLPLEYVNFTRAIFRPIKGLKLIRSSFPERSVNFYSVL